MLNNALDNNGNDLIALEVKRKNQEIIEKLNEYESLQSRIEEKLEKV
jgi:hypothetical protein